MSYYDVYWGVKVGPDVVAKYFGEIYKKEYLKSIEDEPNGGIISHSGGTDEEDPEEKTDFNADLEVRKYCTGKIPYALALHIADGDTSCEKFDFREVYNFAANRWDDEHLCHKWIHGSSSTSSHMKQKVAGLLKAHQVI